VVRQQRKDAFEARQNHHLDWRRLVNALRRQREGQRHDGSASRRRGRLVSLCRA